MTLLDSGVTSIAAGYSHSCAVHNGAAKCWGNGNDGRLGNSGTAERPYANTTVSGLSSGVNAIVAGSGHSCATTTSGSVKCWGYGGGGQLGNGTSSGSPIPVDVRPK